MSLSQADIQIESLSAKQIFPKTTSCKHQVQVNTNRQMYELKDGRLAMLRTVEKYLVMTS